MTLTVWCFSFWNTGIIFLSTDTQHVQPKQYRWFSLGLRSSTMQLGFGLLLGEWFIVISTVLPHFMHMWQIGPNLSSRIRWCLALASVRPQWCLLWRLYVCACVFARVNGRPDLVCEIEACLIRVIFVNCVIRNLGIYPLLLVRISGACNVCPSCVLWPGLIRVPLWWCHWVSQWGC